MTRPGTTHVHNQGQSLRGIISLPRLRTKVANSVRRFVNGGGNRNASRARSANIFIINGINGSCPMANPWSCKDLQLEFNFSAASPESGAMDELSWGSPCKGRDSARILGTKRRRAMFSRSSGYALQALTYLAAQPSGTLVGAAEIATRLEIPMPFLWKILRKL